jgi:hypothetical protein
MEDNAVHLLKHQEMFLSSLTLYKSCQYFFNIGGYGSGKSFTIGQTMLKLASDYAYSEVVIGIGAPTISLMKKTFLLDLEILLKKSNVDYAFDRNSNIFTIQGVQFLLIATGYPTDIYSYNVNAFLCDELDELSLEYGEEAFKAISERSRITFPDGRSPFAAFYSTAQGYKTLYSTIRSLKEKDIGYVLVRGLTKDNPYNSKGYYDNLYKIYNENERRAYLEGLFVNLQTGMVYPDFIEEEMVIEPFDISDGESIFVGQDINDFFNKVVCCIIKNNNIFIIKTMSVPNIGNVPAILRNTFPTQAIFYFPDVGGQSKTIINAYLNEFRIHNIQLRMGTSNPNIVERVFIMNKLFKTSRLFLFKICTDLAVALKTRCFDKLGKPAKGKDENAPDHYCDSMEYVLYRIVKSVAEFIEFMRTIGRSNDN